jgi:uncharacterized membrane protein HdeD (DUF308 family)
MGAGRSQCAQGGGTLLLGLLIVGRWPVNSVYILGLFLGIDLVMAGTGWIGLGFALTRRG